MDYILIIFIGWCITTLIGALLFLTPVLWRRFIIKQVAMEDHFGIPFFLLSTIPVISVIIYLIYLIYLIPLSWIMNIKSKIDAINKKPINCPKCGTEHTAIEYRGESFHTSQPCKVCGVSMTISKTAEKGMYTVELSELSK